MYSYTFTSYICTVYHKLNLLFTAVKFWNCNSLACNNFTRNLQLKGPLIEYEGTCSD